MIAVLTIACFLLVLTVLVVVHEAGHAVVARLCGVRVTEFFVGMPFGPKLSWRSRRSGIEYGATLALLGGYTKIAGMLPEQDPRASLALALVNARGRLSAGEFALVAGCDPEEAAETLALLADWGSIEADPVAPAGTDASPEFPAYRTVRRDAAGLTVYDRGHDFRSAGVCEPGDPYMPPVSADAFYEQERARTYGGVGLPKRLAILVAGVVCNVALALVLLMGYCMFVGVPTVTGIDPAFQTVEEGSKAALAGMEAGDRILSVDGAEVDGAQQIADALEAARGRGPVEVTYLHGDQERTASVELGEGDLLGVRFGYVVGIVPLGPYDSLRYALEYTGRVASSVASLLVPGQAREVLQESAGIVGIASLTHDALLAGAGQVLVLVAMLSMSLGWMNLLPIPPLDGGKVLIEVVQAVLRRPVSLSVQGALGLAGMALFGLLFVYMLVQDVSHIAGA